MARALPDTLSRLSPEARKRLKPRAPRFVKPMLATLSDRRDFDDGWLVEHKFDGERCLAILADGKVTLRSRSERDITTTYPELVDAVAAQPVQSIVLDGEVVATDGDEALGFSRLQQRLGVQSPPSALIEEVPIALCVFDILHLDGYETTGLTVDERRSLLSDSVDYGPALRLTEDERGEIAERYRRACEAGWEGLIAKRIAATYSPGRSRDWLKLKCVAEQEFVIGGYTAPRGSRVGFGALLVGYNEDGRLRYAGKVGTGFGDSTLRDLKRQLDRLEQETSPFDEPVKPRPAGARWVRPELVAQIGFAEWTRAGRLRQPRFLGLRDDKSAREVVRERAS